MRLGSSMEVVRISITDGLSQAPEPVFRPRKFDTQNGQAYRYKDKRGPRCNDHYDAYEDHSRTDDADDNPARRFIGEMYCPFHQAPGPSFFRRLVVALGL
jgi:hypothetical protein